MEMAGRGVVITGAAGGVGTVVTRRWLEAGAKVFAVDHKQANLDRLRGEVGGGDGRLFGAPLDITGEAGAVRMVAEAESAFGAPPDTLLHLVGGFAMGPLDGPDAPAQWGQMMALNLHSVFHCYRAFVPALKRRGGGWIVGLGSRAAVTPGANVAAYAASKAGLNALTQALSAEVRDARIHVSVLLASTIDTPANRAAMGDKKADTWVKPEDVAEATFYLCSDRAAAVHGATLELYARA